MEEGQMKGKVEMSKKLATCNAKKVKAGKRLAEWNHRKKEELAQKSKGQESKPKLSQD